MLVMAIIHLAGMTAFTTWHVHASTNAVFTIRDVPVMERFSQPGQVAADIARWNIAPLCIASDEFGAAQQPRGIQFWQYINDTTPGLFTYARLHNMFTDASGDRRGAANTGGAVVTRELNGTLTYNWTRVINVYDQIVGGGMIPFVEIGFMPRALSSNPASHPERHAPATMSEWTGLVTAFLDLAGRRYGNATLELWRFEVWNEPDIDNFWEDSRASFFELYNATARAIKAYNPALKVGGPALASKVDFLHEFLGYCELHGVPLDLISFHAKGGERGDDSPALETFLDKVRAGLDAIASHPAFNQASGKVEIFLSEADDIVGSHVNKIDEPAFAYRDTEYYAAYLVNMLVKTTRLAIERGVTIHGFMSHNIVFPWETRTFHGTRSFVTPLFLEGTPAPGNIPADMPLPPCDAVVGKPVFVAAQLVGRIPRNASFLLESTMTGLPAAWGMIDGLAFRGGNGTYHVLVAHQEASRHARASRTLAISLDFARDDGSGGSGGSPIQPTVARVREWRIDRSHNNPFRAWEALGSPSRVTGESIAVLQASARLSSTGSAIVPITGGKLTMNLELPAHSCLLLEIQVG